MAKTLVEAKIDWLRAAANSNSRNLTELETQFYPSRSLLPAASYTYSLQDHKLAFFRNQIGSSTPNSIVEAEYRYWALKGAVGSTLADRGYDFYLNRPFVVPNAGVYDTAVYDTAVYG